MRMMFASIMFAAASCFAYVVGPNGEWAVNYPTELKTNGKVTYNATPAMCAAAGWRYATQAEIDANVSAEAAAQAEAEALRGPAPEVFVPMLNSDGEPVGTARLIVDSDTLELVAVINSESPQRTWAEQKADFMAALSTLAARRATLAASRMAIKQTVLEGELSQDELDEIAALWPPWESGVAVAVDEIYSYNSALYRVVQAHTTQADWTPDVTPALFAVIAPPGIIPEWVQPTGGHDAYQTGDRVTHNGHTWVSTVDANVWEPGVYGWTQEE